MHEGMALNLLVLQIFSLTCAADTIWYEHWVIPNSNEHSRQCTLKLKAFFVANYDTWKSIPYSKLRQIFREACQREIELWAVGEEPGIVE
ncbi:hypothetical protein BC826DRAFT_1018029 [Russula brevipes]|nr:hypothetical protein BC826DRAFT_1018029 [Russula brevipes]